MDNSTHHVAWQITLKISIIKSCNLKYLMFFISVSDSPIPFVGLKNGAGSKKSVQPLTHNFSAFPSHFVFYLLHTAQKHNLENF